MVSATTVTRLTGAQTAQGMRAGKLRTMMPPQFARLQHPGAVCKATAALKHVILILAVTF